MKAKSPIVRQALLPSVLLFLLLASPALSIAQEPTASPAVCTVAAGRTGIHYEGEGRTESLVQGPTALAIGADGSFWIADPVGNRLWHVGAGCQPVAPVKLPESVVGAADLEVTSSGIWVLDIAAVPPAVLRLSSEGEELARYAIPEEMRVGLSGIGVGQKGELLVEGENGALLHQLVDPAGKAAPLRLDGYHFAGHSFSTEPAEGQGWYATVDGRQVEGLTSGSLDGLWFLGPATGGRFYVVAEEVSLAGTIQVDQTVREYSSDGISLGVARVPLDDSHSYVPHALAVGPDGQVFALVTLSDRIEIRRLTFAESLSPVLSTQMPSDAGGPRSLSEPETCISGATIASNAESYLHNSKYLSLTNISGACAGRTVPRYLGSPGTYESVPYDWGGWTTVSAFNGYMDPGTYQAGDADTTPESCSKGVDCSGFVTRAWGRSDKKYSTTALPSISWRLPSTGSLIQGDIMLKPSVHAIIFDRFTTNGIYAWEATKNYSYDRVVWTFGSWTRLKGYIPYRYNELCDPCGGQYRSEYYNNTALTGTPTFTQCEAWPLGHDWGNGGPGNGVGNDHFSARWLGTFSFAGGDYTFIARSSDGIRVWLDGTLLLDKWFDQQPTDYRVTTSVSAGAHRVRVEYYEHTGSAVARLSW